METLLFEQENVSELILYSSIICVLLLNFVMIFLYDSLSGIYTGKMKMELLEREKEYYHNESELLQKNHDDLKKFRHDEKNKMIVIRQMLQQGEYKKALQYVDEIEEKLEESRIYSNTGNVIFDSILNYKLSCAERKGIKIITDITIAADIELKNDDIVIIFSNLIDNAIEASEYLEEDRYIRLRVGYDRNCLRIQIENRYDTILNKRNGNYETRKSNRLVHGIGISSVQSVVDKYNGVLELEQEKDKFIAKVFLYI